jgi:hypothetical protein
MQFSQDPNVWIIYGLVFLLGLLLGVFMTAGGRKKWKTRYYDEVDRRKVLETSHAEAEREWRERDSLRDAAERDRLKAVAAAPAAGTVAARDINNDGVVTPAERKTGFVDRMLGRDRDGDGVADATVTGVDRDRDGVDDNLDRRPDDGRKA